ncbi:MAG: hypothetical protein ACKO38_16465 [Planctomycetota bacterium]
MTFAQADIDRVVREVLQRLLEAHTIPPSPVIPQPTVVGALNPTGKSAAKAFDKPVAKQETKTVAKPATRQSAKPADKFVLRPTEKLVAKPVSKTIAKPADKASVTALSRPVSPAVSVVASSVASSMDSRVWEFSDRLVTVSALEAMPAGTRVLSARPGTVITPSARDRLRQLRVELSFSSGAVVASAAPSMKLYLHAAKDPAKLAKTAVPRVASYRSTRFQSATLASPHSWPARQSVLRALQGVAASIETLIAAPLDQTAAELSAVLAAPQHLGVLFTTERDWAACVANRRESIRAVVATDKVAIEAAARDWGANLLIVDDRRSSPHTIRGWIDTFLRVGPRVCPTSRAHWLAEDKV